MKKDAHYYCILACARAAGINRDTAVKIAYSSQFVDDAQIDHLIPKKMAPLKEYDTIDGVDCFYDMASCHSYFKVKTLNYTAMINKTTAFHFLPSGEGESFVRKMRCKENSPLCQQLVNKAVKSSNPYKLGIALHVYADTFSHQGFSGLISKVNDVKKIRLYSNYFKILPFKFILVFQALLKNNFDEFFDKIIPPYGHGQVLSYPDLPFLKWSYYYDYTDEFSQQYKFSGIIDNPLRYKRAFKNIYKFLCDYAELNPEIKEEVKPELFDSILSNLIIRKGDKYRMKNWQRFLVKEKLMTSDDKYLKYSIKIWLHEAFKNYNKKMYLNRKVEDAELIENFENSNWYSFYLAVKWYKKQFFLLTSINNIDLNIQY